jgi:hypothetical protein
MGGHDYAIDQANRVVPPRIVYSQTSPGNALSTSVRAEGQVICLQVTGTSKAYDLTSILWGGQKSGKSGDFDLLYVSMQCESNDVYFLFDQEPATFGNTIDDTLQITAGTALSLTNGVAGTPPVPTATAYPPGHLPVGLTPVDYMLERQIDRTLIVKCSGSNTAKLRIWASSPLSPGAT